MKIFDCFSYLDEEFLLNIRLNILNPYVDYFVIIEGDRTWQNNFKGFKLNLNKFKKFKKKIIYIKVKDLPQGDNPWAREHYQRNCITRGLTKATNDDLIIISDLDEIPNLEKLVNFEKKMKYAVFKQKNFYYKFNLQSNNYPYWYGSRICFKKYLKSPQWLRGLKFKKRPFWRIDKYRLNNIIEDGGWHFCNLKSPEDLLFKYKNLCETNDPYIFKEKINKKHLSTYEIRKKIMLRKDIIGRKDTFKKITVDKTFPKFLIKNIKKFKNWIA